MTLVPIVLIIVVVCTLFQLYYWQFRFRKIASPSNSQPAPTSLGVSIVICAHNECDNLVKNLPQILNQDYSNFEVIVVDHGSTDRTADLLKALRPSFPNLLEVHHPLDAIGKKHALHVGIEQAKHERILLTDADCAPSSRNWIKYMVAPFDKSAEVVLGAAPFVAQDHVLNNFARFGSAITYLQYALAATEGTSFMGVGRNMAYLKSVYEQKTHLSSTYIGGDDDILVSQNSRRNIYLVTHKEAMMWSEAPKGWGQFLRQKRRHVSVSWAYSTGQKLALLLFAGSHWGHICGIISLILMGEALWLSCALIVLRLWAMVSTLRKHAGYFIMGMSILRLLVADVFYIVQYPLIALFLILKPPKKW